MELVFSSTPSGAPPSRPRSITSTSSSSPLAAIRSPRSGSCATLYVMALSSTLVATGLVPQSHPALGPFLAVVLPTLFVLGLFTIVRLVDSRRRLQCLICTP
jgi:hypothetical protein